MSFVRYVAVQVLAYAMDLGLFLLLFGLAGAGPMAANVVAKVGGGLFAYLSHRHFTFGVSEQGGQVRPALLYMALWTLTVPLSTALLGVLVLLDALALVAKVVADVMCVGLNYWISKKYIFVGSAKRRVLPPVRFSQGKRELS